MICNVLVTTDDDSEFSDLQSKRDSGLIRSAGDQSVPVGSAQVSLHFPSQLEDRGKDAVEDLQWIHCQRVLEKHDERRLGLSLWAWRSIPID